MAHLQKLEEFSLSLVIVFTAVSNLNRSLVFSSTLSIRSFEEKKIKVEEVKFLHFRTPSGTRTLDPLIKSQLLYQLS